MERMEKGLQLARSGQVRKLVEDCVVYEVHGYEVKFWPKTGVYQCSCPDFEHRGNKAGVPCKHIFAVMAIRSREL